MLQLQPVCRLPGSFQGASRELQGASREPSGSFPGASSELPGSLQGASRELPGRLSGGPEAPRTALQIIKLDYPYA